MEFYTQELHREVNTMGSKSHDIILTEKVINAKAIVERLREQVQNAYINAESQQYEERIRRIHRLERHIAEMQAQPRNEGREQTLKDFRRELDMLRGSNAT